MPFQSDASRRRPTTLAVVKLRIFVEPQQGASYDTLLNVAQAAEAAGFDAFFRSDHFLTMGGDGLPGPTDAWLTLGAIARETERIRLGTLVTSATFRAPGLLAIEVAQVDAMSGGRVELGLGAGWYDAEHTAYGFEFPPLGERFERLEETFAILTGLWGTPVDEKFSFDGRHFHLKDSPALPKPAQHPHPPLIVGGGGAKRTPRLAATYANEFNLPFSSLADTEAQFARVQAACEDRGRDPKTLHLSAAQVVCCGRDEQEIERRAAAIGRKPDELRANGAAGTPDEVVTRLEAFAGIGAETVVPPGARPPRPRPHRVVGPRGPASGLLKSARQDVLGGVAVQPTHGPWPLNQAGMLGESVGGLVGSRTGARGDWLKSKSLVMLPRIFSFSRTSGRGSGRPSVLGLRREPPRKSSSMNFR